MLNEVKHLWPTQCRVRRFALVLAATLLLGACSLDPNSCEYRCNNRDAPCIDALVADGIISSGDELDEGLCNGICSVLRTSGSRVKQEWKEFGFEGEPPPHVCLRPPGE